MSSSLENSIIFKDIFIGYCIAPSRLLSYEEIKYLLNLDFTVIYRNRVSYTLFYKSHLNFSINSRYSNSVEYKISKIKLYPFRSKEEILKYFTSNDIEEWVS